MVDIQPTTTQPISDDQELAKVLAGVTQQSDNAMQFEETSPASDPVGQDSPVDNVPPVTPDPVPAPDPAQSFAAPSFQAGSDDLAPIKTEAINELRPLVDKLTLPPEEKFDTYLLLLRSTDDRSLIAPAHAAAREITDESKKAQALLDIIKEIDFLNQPSNQQ